MPSYLIYRIFIEITVKLEEKEEKDLLYSEYSYTIELKTLLTRIETLEELGGTDEDLNEVWKELDDLMNEVTYIRYN